jgi:hypothetical protein
MSLLSQTSCTRQAVSTSKSCSQRPPPIERKSCRPSPVWVVRRRYRTGIRGRRARGVGVASETQGMAAERVGWGAGG